MIRSFKYIAIRSAGNPQPLVGALVAVSYGPGAAIILQVDDNSPFKIGDRVLLCEKDGTNAESSTVTNVNVDGTHITVSIVTKPHVGGVIGTGGFVVLNECVNSTYVQTKDGNGGAIFLGTVGTMVKATGVGVIVKLQNVAAGQQPVDFSDSRTGFPDASNASDLWVDGSTGDSYLPSFGRL